MCMVCRAKVFEPEIFLWTNHRSEEIVQYRITLSGNTRKNFLCFNLNLCFKWVALFQLGSADNANSGLEYALSKTIGTQRQANSLECSCRSHALIHPNDPKRRTYSISGSDVPDVKTRYCITWLNFGCLENNGRESSSYQKGSTCLIHMLLVWQCRCIFWDSNFLTSYRSLIRATRQASS